MAEASEVPAEEDGGAKPEVHREDEIVTKFLHRLVCQLCNNIFKEDIPIACVHFTFCRKCLEKNGLPADLGHDMGMVCTPCSKISVSRNQQLDSKQLNTLSLMQSQSRRGDVNSLSEGLSAVLHITDDGDDDPERHLDSSLLAVEQSPLVSVPDGINSSDSSQSFPAPRSESPQGATSSSIPSLPDFSQPTNGGTIRCTPIVQGQRSPGRSCETCDLITNVPGVIGPNDTVHVQGNFTCKSTHVIYYINCKRCSKPYVGQTTQMLRSRISQHLLDIENNKPSSAVAKHFNMPEKTHTVKTDFQVFVLKSFHPSTLTKNVWKMEQDLMNRLGTKEPRGMNER